MQDARCVKVKPRERAFKQFKTPVLNVLNWRSKIQISVVVTSPPQIFAFRIFWNFKTLFLESSWNVMAHCDTREGKWRGNWRMEWGSQYSSHYLGTSSITTADAHTSAANSRLNWRPRWFKWTRPFRRERKSGFSSCAITFPLASKTQYAHTYHLCTTTCNMYAVQNYEVCSSLKMAICYGRNI